MQGGFPDCWSVRGGRPHRLIAARLLNVVHEDVLALLHQSPQVRIPRHELLHIGAVESFFD